jgi:CRP-like cAMP-binding protein
MRRTTAQIGPNRNPEYQAAAERVEGKSRRDTAWRTKTKEEATMQFEARTARTDAAAPHSLAELMDCPPATGNLLIGSTKAIEFEAGRVVFEQFEMCRGLYVILSGRFARQTERMNTRLMLGPARTGDLVELSAVLGDERHTYTLSAQTSGSVLLLEMDALKKAFAQYPLLRMRLLEEFAREVSRAYTACCMTRTVKARRRRSASMMTQGSSTEE